MLRLLSCPHELASLAHWGIDRNEEYVFGTEEVILSSLGAFGWRPASADEAIVF